MSAGPWIEEPFDGDVRRCRPILQQLSREMDFRFMFFRRQGDLRAIDMNRLEDFGVRASGLEVVKLPRYSKARRLSGLLRYRLPPLPELLRSKSATEATRALASLCVGWEPDVLLVWGVNEASLFRQAGKGMFRALHVCDSPSMVAGSMAQGSRSAMFRLYKRLLARRYRRYEAEVLPEFDRLIFVSNRDAQQACLPRGTPVSVIGLGVDVETFRPVSIGSEHDGPVRLVFHGHLGSVANAEAVSLLLQVVGPPVAQELGPEQVHLELIGWELPKAIAHRAQALPWVDWSGYADDIAAALARADIYLAPLTMGGGIKTKVLEAMACGLPVIGTPESFAGLDVPANACVLVGSIDRMPDATVALAKDRRRRRALGRSARRWVESHAGWDSVVESFRALLWQARGRAAEAG